MLLRAKHWQVFALLVAFAVACDVLEFIDIRLHPVIFFVGHLVTFGWYLLLGISLKSKIGSELRTLYRLFLFSAFALALIPIITLPFVNALQDFGSMNGTIVSITIVLTLLYLLITLLIFPAKALRVAEIGTDIDINDYFSDIFRFLVWPIGIWNIQPRLNKLAQRDDLDK